MPADIRYTSRPSPFSVSRRLSTRTVDLAGELPRVLIVDDEPAARDAQFALLRIEGFDVRTAASGVEAIELVRGWIPHAVVLDVQMDEHDGFTVATILRGMPSTANVVILASSGFDMQELSRRGSLEKFDAIFQKGDDGGALVKLIRLMLVGSEPPSPPMDQTNDA